MTTLAVDDLLTMSDAGVNSRIPARFLDCLKLVPEVRSVFFASQPAPSPLPNQLAGIRPLDAGWVKLIAVALVAAVVPKLVVRNFNELIDEGRVNAVLDRELAPQSAAALAASRAVYDSEFGSYAISKGGNAFQAYLADRTTDWGSALADAITSQAFQTKTDIESNIATPEEKSRLSQWLTLLVYMVGRLNPAKRELVLRNFQGCYPGLYSGEEPSHLVRADYTGQTFFDDVSNAASVRRYVPMAPVFAAGPMRSVPPPTYYTWGPDFRDFLAREAGPYRTGTRANDLEAVSIFSCFTHNTPISLSNGQLKPIGAIQPGDSLLTADGQTATCSSEEIARVVEAPTAIFGINEHAPFVSQAHILLTSSGPKAFDPTSARAINPDVPVEQLKVGDQLLRLASLDPFSMEDVTVERITQAELAVGESLYAPVLQGPQSYFAHGFLVAANYASLTESRIADGIFALSPDERAHLCATLRPVMPLLLTLLRGFAGPRLKQALMVEPEGNPCTAH